MESRVERGKGHINRRRIQSTESVYENRRDCEAEGCRAIQNLKDENKELESHTEKERKTEKGIFGGVTQPEFHWDLFISCTLSQLYFKGHTGS